MCGGKSCQTSCKLGSELRDMSQALGGRKLIVRSSSLSGRAVEHHQFAHGAGERGQRLGIGLARRRADRQIGEAPFMCLDLAAGGAPELADDLLAVRGQAAPLRRRRHRGVIILCGHGAFRLVDTKTPPEPCGAAAVRSHNS
jgi:hypothetical protein